MSSPDILIRDYYGIPESRAHLRMIWERWTLIFGQSKDDMSAFLHYSGDKLNEKEEKIA